MAKNKTLNSPGRSSVRWTAAERRGGAVAGGRRTVKVEIRKNTTEAKPAWRGEAMLSVEIFSNTTLTGIVPQRVGTDQAGRVKSISGSGTQ